MRHAPTIGFAAAASLLTLALTLPGVAKAPSPTTTWLPAHMGSDSPAVSFTMNKWLDAKGTQKAAVKGGFTHVVVALNKPVAKLTSLNDLKGLKGKVTVDLAHVETGNPARNLNISNTYFETAKFATATVLLDRLQTVATPADRMHREQQADLSVDGSINLHGVSRPFKATQWHVAKRPDGLHVSTLAPITVKSADFALPAAALMKICQHLGLDPAATVTVDLILK
jgi:polyisoprenoid-binding protein YceI